MLPSNVTRLNQNGLTLCPLKTSASQLPAVIFVVDESASMDSALNGYAAGDPAHWRSKLVRYAIQYMHSISGSGWFSYIQFAAGVNSTLTASSTNDCNPAINGTTTKLFSSDFLSMSDSVVNAWTAVTGPVQNRCQSGTDYYSALEQAKSYAVNFNPGDVIANPVVIFISDGYPNQNTKKTFNPMSVTDSIPGVFPPIYGIFLGSDTTADGATLAKLSDTTGGQYNIVNPGDTAQMKAVMNKIIQMISNVSKPTTVNLQINGASYAGVTTPVPGGSAQVTFPQSIPLIAGTNPVEMDVNYVDSAGLPRTKTTVFTLSVSGAAKDTGVFAIDSMFSTTCAIGNSLVVNGLTNPLLVSQTILAQTPHLDSDTLKSLAIKLDTRRYVSTSTQMTVYARRTGDSVTVTLPAVNTNGLYQFALAVKLSGQDSRGVPKAGSRVDSILQVAPFDTLVLRWKNPSDPRDTIFGNLLLYSTPKVMFNSDTLAIDQISATVTDASVSGLTAPVEYRWSNGQAVSAEDLRRIDSSLSFNTTSNLKSQLLSELTNKLVVVYVDPLFNTTYTDTATLVFSTPVLPVAWMLDADGDGRADQLKLTYATSPAASQHFPSFQVIWGAENQDTMFLRVDSLNPALSSDIVKITKTSSGGEQWLFDLTPLPFAHTSGNGVRGQGTLVMKGWFDNRNIERVIPLEDKVGPVLTEMWIDPTDVTLSYFRVSEPLSTTYTGNWVLDSRSGAPEWTPQVDSVGFSEVTGIYSMRLKDSPDNRVLGGDSARLIYSSKGGVQDLNGNGAETNNPFVLVRGTRGASNSMTTNFVQALVHGDNVVVNLVPQAGDSTGDFHVLLQNSSTHNFTEPTGESVDQNISKSMPTLRVDASLPQLYGLDSNGRVLQGMLVDGKLAWTTEIQVKGCFYDQLGQFITCKTAHVSIDDTSKISSTGSTSFALIWTPDSKKGLITRSGRAVGSGVILAKVQADLISTAQVDLNIYDASGNVSDKSIKKGAVIHKKQETISMLGYLRK